MKHLILAILLSMTLGCSSALIPKTSNQLQVVSYSQVHALAADANRVYSEGLITDEEHKEIHDKLLTAMRYISSEDGADSAVEILNKIREKLE